MSSVVCQGLQSCLEPRLVEPRVLRHKLAPPRSNSSPENPHSEEETKSKNGGNENGESGGWSFIKALTNTPQNPKEAAEMEKVYVHPLVKRSSSTLSKKSLEMCTESLGSETGSDISEGGNDFLLQGENSRSLQRSQSREFGKKPTSWGGGSFPPPLTSISGSDGVRVRPHREGGRLVMRAITVASSDGYFQAERGGGRLRLCLLKDTAGNRENEEVDHDDGEEVCDDDDDDVEEGVNGDECDNDEWVEGVGGSNENFGGEIEINGELPCSSRPSSCKEGGRRMSSWGPFWVAIS